MIRSVRNSLFRVLSLVACALQDIVHYEEEDVAWQTLKARIIAS